MSAFLPLCASSAGTGHSEERHEPPPARVHGDVFNEERPGCPDGDLQEAHHTEWRQVTHTHTLLDSLVVLVYMTCAKHQARAHAEQRPGYCSFTMADVQCHGVSVS